MYRNTTKEFDKMSRNNNKEEACFLRDRLKELDICKAEPNLHDRNLWYRYHCVMDIIINSAEGCTFCDNCEYNNWFEFGGMKESCCCITGLGNKVV